MFHILLCIIGLTILFFFAIVVVFHSLFSKQNKDYAIDKERRRKIYAGIGKDIDQIEKD